MVIKKIDQKAKSMLQASHSPQATSMAAFFCCNIAGPQTPPMLHDNQTALMQQRNQGPKRELL